MNRIALHSPFGLLFLTETDGAITGLGWGEAPLGEDTPLLAEARRQLEDYFAGTRHAFDLPLAPPGSAFQRAVCTAMCAIPYGETRTYGDIAAALGASAQAVGTACGANPIPVLIPCHRVLAAHSLGG